MGYIEDNLLPNEKVLLRARVHPAVFLPSGVAFLLALLFLFLSLAAGSDSIDGGVWFFVALGTFLYAILLGVKGFVLMATTEFGVTNRRIIAKTGFIRRHTLEMLLSQVESVSVDQNILGRMMNFGVVKVVGTGGTEESFRAIVDPLKVRRVIHRIIEARIAAG